MTRQAYLDAMALAREIDDTLLVTAFEGASAVRVVSELGTSLFFDAAFARRYGEFYLVFTEHEGTHVFHAEDYHVAAYREERIPTLTKRERRKFARQMARYRSEGKLPPRRSRGQR